MLNKSVKQIQYFANILFMPFQENSTTLSVISTHKFFEFAASKIVL